MSYYEKTANAKEIEKRYRQLYPLATGVQPVPEQPEDAGYVKPGGWGADLKNPGKWKVVNMKDDPKLFKVVDGKNKNVATNFRTKAGAQAFINKAKGQTTPTPPPETKDEGYVKPGGWGGDVKSPTHWKAVKMKDDPSLWKVVDRKGKNIATNFKTQQGAQAFIQKAIELQQQDGDPLPPEQQPDDLPPTPEPTEPPGVTPEGPYPMVGKQYESEIEGPKIRHYASGKPDDRTIEANIGGIKTRNHQFIVSVTMKAIEHDDNVSLKGGGTHMKSGWFDHGVSFETGQTCLGYEPDHPETHLCVIKGPKIGNIVNKRITIAMTYWADENYTEFWYKTGTGWKLGAGSGDVDGFNPNSNVFEYQLRIDGFKTVPEIHQAIAQDIGPRKNA